MKATQLTILKKTLSFVLALAAVCIIPSCVNEPKNTTNGHEWVDLGLPSGTLWATCNVGANSPEEYGNYYSWGETQPKVTYFWDTYRFDEGPESSPKLKKYNTDAQYGIVDNLTTLQQDDDAATANWGDRWRTPTDKEWKELLDNCELTWTNLNGVVGLQFTGSNGNFIFLPAAGFYYNDVYDEKCDRFNSGRCGQYWSSMLDPHFNDSKYMSKFPLLASGICFSEKDNVTSLSTFRQEGLSVRPVRMSK